MPPLVIGPRLGPLAGKARTATIGIAVSMVASLFSIGVALVRRRELVRVSNGEFVSGDRLWQLDHWVHIAAVIALLGLVAGAACFIPWFHRAYKNLMTWHVTRFSSGWAIGGWFVPFANLVLPYLIAKELASLSGPKQATPTKALHLWWAMVIIAAIGNRYMVSYDPKTVDEFITFDTISPIVDTTWILAGICLIVLVRKVTKAQQETWLRDV